MAAPNISFLFFAIALLLCQLIDLSSQATLLDSEYRHGPKVLSDKQKSLIQLLKSIVSDETNEPSNQYLPTNLYSADNQANEQSLPDISSLLNNQLDYNQAAANDYETNVDDYYPNVDDGFYYAVDGQDAWFDGPVAPKVEPQNELDEAEKKKLYDDVTEQIEKLLQKDILTLMANGGMDKRRQKIVIKDDSKRDASTPAPTTTTTTTTASPSMSEELKMKLLHKSRIVHRGQKEVAMLRPAEAKQKDEWPSELEETSMSEEESLKELPARGQSRPVRDVLTSQLDSLKTESNQANKEQSSEQQQH